MTKFKLYDQNGNVGFYDSCAKIIYKTIGKMIVHVVYRNSMSYERIVGIFYEDTKSISIRNLLYLKEKVLLLIKYILTLRLIITTGSQLKVGF